MTDTVTRLIWQRRAENGLALLLLSPRFLFALIGWSIEFCLSMSLAVAGALIAVPVAIVFRQVVPSPINRNIIITAPDWLWLFGNDEDGYCSAEAQRHYNLAWPHWFNMWWWAAIRNPVGNLRFISQLYPPPHRRHIRFVQADNWALTWQGLLYHFAWLTPTRVYTIGWKYYPGDARRDADYGWRRYGCGFALRIRARRAEDSAATA